MTVDAISCHHGRLVRQQYGILRTDIHLIYEYPFYSIIVYIYVVAAVGRR